MLFAGRAFRRVGLGRNPLRRPIDRLEAWITLVLALALVLAVPGAAWRAGHIAYATGLRTERVERANRLLADAVLTAEPPSGAEHAQRVVVPSPAATGSARVRATAQWTAADGTSRSGPVMVGVRWHPGTRVQLWVNRQGDLADPPQQRIQTVVDAMAVAALTGTGVAGLVMVMRALVRRALDARRMAQWEAAWWRFEPRWSGRS
jgi:hypothetical protein